MRSVSWDSSSYLVDGRPEFIYSGEMHYFRIPPKDWRRRMRLLKKAGGNCLATYVPWLIHEPEEGSFVFKSKDRKLNVEDFLSIAAEEDVHVIARPGPYQYSELVCDGLPRWLCDNYPSLRAKTWEGDDYRQSSISYLHPLFLQKAAKWFDAVIPLLARFQTSRGGPIAFVQVDNEIGGIHKWFYGGDYNAETLGLGSEGGLYSSFLKGKYGSVEELNKLCSSSFKSFAEARPPKPSQASNLDELRAQKDYVEFYFGSLGLYCRKLAELFRERGVDVPLITNSPNPDSNYWFADAMKSVPKPFLIGSDHYYCLSQDWKQNNPTPQYAANVFYSLESLRCSGYPPSVFELPSGSLSDWPAITPEDIKACYFSNLALGMKACNLYVFTGGPNVANTGSTTDVYDYSAPVSADGSLSPIYKSVKSFGDFVKENPWLASASRPFDFRFGLSAECAWNGELSFKSLVPCDERQAHELLVRGIVTTAFCAGLSPAATSLDDDSLLDDVSTPLAVASSSVMPKAIQERLVKFLSKGGRLLLCPVLPSLDERFQPCSTLADFLGAKTPSKKSFNKVRVDIAGVSNVYSNGDCHLWDSIPEGAETVGVDVFSGRPVAWSVKSSGGGKALVLGLKYQHGVREHSRMLVALLEALGLKRLVESDNHAVWISVLKSGSERMLFAMNLGSSKHSVNVKVRESGDAPWSDLGQLKLAPMEVKAVKL